MTDLDDLEQELTRLLDERAGGLEHVVAPTGRLVAEGESAAKRQRRVRTWSAVGAAAAVLLAVGIPVALTHGSDRAAPIRPAISPTTSATPSAMPTSIMDLPEAASGPGWVYTRGDRIVIGTAGDAPWDGNQILGAPGQAGAPPVALWTERGSDVVHTWRDGRDVAFGSGPDALSAHVFDFDGVAISPDGSTVYSTRPIDKSTVLLSAYDARSGGVIRTREEAQDPGGDLAWPMIAGDSEGRMYLAGGPRDSVRRWDPRTGAVVQVHGMPDQLGFVGPGVVGVLPGGHEEFGTVDDAGLWHHVIDLPMGQAVWSADGTMAMLGARRAQHVLLPAKVVDVATGREITLGLPPDAVDHGVGFEQDSTGTPPAVLVVASAGRGSALVRCVLDTGGCERVLDLGDGDTLATGPTTY